ncbi:MAG: bifunctional DNA primase/polymerase, partial [Fimbriimonadales bacterium]|nr:bifunctional DNA primase/polymerase [Fimbriimonadales bacterium]
MVNPILDAARAYLAKGWRPIPLSRTKGAGNDRGKHPDVESGWQLPAYYEAVAANPDAHFQANHNIGILLSVSRLADVDLDSPEARLLAEAFLPPTPARFGRRSTPRAHWIYRIAGDLPRTTPYDDPAPREGEKARLVELRCLSSRGTPVQSMFPPSLHMPSGEQVQWEGEDAPEPAEVDGESLHAAVGRLAAAALLARRWHEGARHELALCVAGALARAGWAETDAAEFLLAVATAAGDRELSDRRRAVADTYEAFQKGDAITGLPTLEELLGKPVAERFAKWLNLRRAHGTQESDAKPKREAASLRLAKAALESITELFYGHEGTIYVSLKRNGHVETHPLLSKTFENYLAALCNQLSIVPRDSTLAEAVAYLRGEAAKRETAREVHIRVGG